MRLVIYLLAVVICCLGCRESDSIVKSIYEIDLGSYIKDRDSYASKKPFALSSMTDSIHYIPLVSPDSLPVGEVLSFKATENYFFYLDVRQKLYQFDKEGSFIRLIGNRGSGPEEYLTITGFDIDEALGEVYLYDLQKRTLLTYDIDGVFKNSLALQKDILNISRFYNQLFVGYVQNFEEYNKHTLLFFNSSGETVDSLICVVDDKTKSEKVDIFKMALLNFDSQFYYRMPNDDKVYRMPKDGEAESYIHLFQGKYKLTNEIASNTGLYNKNLNSPYIFEPNIKSFSPFFYIDFFFEMENYRLVYDYENSSFHQISRGRERGSIKNDIDSGIDFWPLFINGDYLVNVIYSHQFEDDKQSDFPQSLQELFIKNDNPVLQIVKYKNGDL